jgi:hypothetical protein
MDTVHGWLRPECAVLVTRLADAQRIAGSVGEIGVHHGKFFILLSVLRRSGESGVAVDLFEDQAHNIDQSGAGDRGIFEANLRRFGADEGISVQSADSTRVQRQQLLDWANGQRFRLFSVDGGLVILDDYFNEAWPGVSEGTNRYLAAHEELVGIGSAHGKTFFTTDEDHAQYYRDTMTRIGREMSWYVSQQPFYGHPHVALVAKPRRRVRAVAEGLVRRVRASLPTRG